MRRFRCENLKNQIGFLIGICTSRGGRWKWIDKLPWTDEQWNQYSSDPKLRTFAGYYDNALAGYYELRRSDASSTLSQRDEHEGEVEIAYFGLLPGFYWSWSGRRIVNERNRKRLGLGADAVACLDAYLQSRSPECAEQLSGEGI